MSLKLVLILALLTLSIAKINPIDDLFCKVRGMHWILALDYSGSMRYGSPPRWSSLVSLVNDYPGGIMDQVDTKPGREDLVTSYLFDGNVYPNII